ncbi:uncharacterized protein METZ01_LOCUS168945, partial [marine metagenome]
VSIPKIIKFSKPHLELLKQFHETITYFQTDLVYNKIITGASPPLN